MAVVKGTIQEDVSVKQLDDIAQEIAQLRDRRDKALERVTFLQERITAVYNEIFELGKGRDEH